MSELRLRNGLPSKACIVKLCDEQRLIIHHLDMYVRLGKITYSYRSDAALKADKVAEQLREAGLEVQHRHANRETGLTGQILIVRAGVQA